jgi:hypothetical protein
LLWRWSFPWRARGGKLEELCPAGRSEPREYQARDGTRCEGFKIPAFAAAAPAIVAVTVKPDSAALSPLPALLDIRVPVSTQPAGAPFPDPTTAVRDELVVRDYRYGYWADRFKMEKQGGYRSFRWPTDLLSRFEVPLSQLQGRATDSRGRFAPVRLAPASSSAPLHYEFAIVALSKLLRLASFSICSELDRACTKDRAVFHEEGDSDAPYSPDLIVVRWSGLGPGGKPLPHGLLRAEVRTLVDGEGAGSGGPIETGSVAVFLHDPSLLK